MSRKEQLIREALRFFPNVQLETSIRSPTQQFRNRAKMTVTGTVEKPIVGLIGEEELDHGQELHSCPIHCPQLNSVFSVLPEMIRTYRLIPYRIQERKGELKGLIGFYSPITQQMYLRFILRSQECVSRLRKLVPVLQGQFPFLKCITANIQPVPHAILEGPKEIVLTDQAVIDHQIGRVRIKLSPQAFVQTNGGVAAQLYQVAADWISEAEVQNVLELFCGQGLFSFFAAESASRILGVELNPNAVKVAEETAHQLGLWHLHFKTSDATQVSGVIDEFKPDLILANPPRRGLAHGIELIQKYRPGHFMYSSCSIESLAMDLQKLVGDYRLRKVQLFDMFPHTEHFETLVWMELK